MASSCEEFSEFRGHSEFKLEPMGGGGEKEVEQK